MSLGNEELKSILEKKIALLENSQKEEKKYLIRSCKFYH